MLGRSLKLGSVFGFELRLDLSVGLLMLLIAFHIGAGLVPSLHPDWSPWLGWGVAVAAAVLFVVSIGLHELSHALVGRSFGIPVSSITFFLFGGVSNIEREPPSPKAEFWMAIVGPLTSAGLGILLLVGGGWLLPGDLSSAAEAEAALKGLGPLPTLMLWLGSINLLLGAFNMIPGFPLDGGRVLRSILWKATGSLETATRWASLAGRGVGWGFVAIGALMAFGVDVPFFGTGLVGGLWLAFIGWFLARAALASEQQLQVRRALEGVSVARLMRREVTTVTPDATIAEVVEVFMARDVATLLVVDGGTLVGLLPLDAVRGVRGAERDTTRARDVMTPARDVEVLDPDGEAEAALKQLVKAQAPELPVVDRDGHPEGVLRLTDVARWVELQGPRDEGGPGVGRAA